MSAVYHLPEPVEPFQPDPEPTAAEWLARDEAALAGVLPRITDLVAVRARVRGCGTPTGTATSTSAPASP